MNLRDCVWEIRYRIIMKTIMQERVTIHCNMTIWYTNFPLPQAMKIPAAKAAVDKEWEDLTKVKSQKDVIDDTKTMGAKIHFYLTDGHLSFQKCRVGGEAPKLQRSNCFPKRFCER